MVDLGQLLAPERYFLPINQFPVAVGPVAQFYIVVEHLDTPIPIFYLYPSLAVLSQHIICLHYFLFQHFFSPQIVKIGTNLKLRLLKKTAFRSTIVIGDIVAEGDPVIEVADDWLVGCSSGV